MPETTQSQNPTPTSGVLEGFTSAEMIMIKKLAGNDPEIRKKTMRKLKKWLNVICKRIPDSPVNSRKICEPNFIRVWKALFYCMWMADKLVPQENLAEQISNLISIFNEKPHVMMLFIEWFLITMAREWPWIDRLRMDKFKMLVRRFLRKTLEEFSKQNWDSDILDPFNKLIHVHVFNHHLPLPKTKGKSAKKTPDPIKAPLGLQIHIVDIFLEELAKVGGEEISNETILKVLEPFIDELCANDDQRLLDEIKERVFHHLMRQSDVGIEFQESGGGKYVRMELDEDDLEEENDNEGCEELIPASNGHLDPRAGQVDVVLPQLQIKYEDLIHSLTEAGGRKTTKQKNRKLLYILAREFQKLTRGDYPLGVPYVNDSRVPAIPRKEVENAAERLVEFEQSLVEPKDKKKKNKKNILVSEGLNDSIHSEDNSLYLNDSELMEHVGDNYQSYLAEMEDEPMDQDKVDNQNQLPSPSINKRKTPKQRNLPLDANVTENNLVLASPVKGKSPKLKRKSLQTDIAKENGDSQDTTEIKAKKIRRNSFQLQPLDGMEDITSEEKPMKKRKSLNMQIQENGHPKEANSFHEVPASNQNIQTKKLKRKSLPAKLDDSPKETYITIKKKNLSKPIGEIKTPLKENLTGSPGKNTPNKITSLIRPETPLTPSGLKKKVNFVLTKNLEHPHHDYPLSIQRSPAIPYDSKKRPSFGLLKSPAGQNSLPFSPKKTTPRKISPIPRKRAAEFFQ